MCTEDGDGDKDGNGYGDGDGNRDGDREGIGGWGMEMGTGTRFLTIFCPSYVPSLYAPCERHGDLYLAIKQVP
jgi:hypothetical protein